MKKLLAINMKKPIVSQVTNRHVTQRGQHVAYYNVVNLHESSPAWAEPLSIYVRDSGF